MPLFLDPGSSQKHASCASSNAIVVPCVAELLPQSKKDLVKLAESQNLSPEA